MKIVILEMGGEGREEGRNVLSYKDLVTPNVKCACTHDGWWLKKHMKTQKDRQDSRNL